MVQILHENMEGFCRAGHLFYVLTWSILALPVTIYMVAMDFLVMNVCPCESLMI